MNPAIGKMLVGLALVAGAFFFSRRASAAEAGAGGGLFDFLGEGGASGGAAGNLGTVPFTEVVQGGGLIPGGPIPLGIPGVSPGRGPTAPATTPKGRGPRAPIPVVGSAPKPAPLPQPTKPGTTPPRQPSAPRPAPRVLPIPRRVGAVEPLLPVPKGGVRRALN